MFLIDEKADLSLEHCSAILRPLNFAGISKSLGQKYVLEAMAQFMFDAISA